MRDSWDRHLLETPEAIGALLDRVRTVAVLGIKPGDDPGQAAWFVPEYAQRAGFKVIPVPVYFPELTEILGERVYRTVAAIPGQVDLVNVFRRSKDVLAHVDDIGGPKRKQALLEHAEDARVSKRLATIQREVDVDVDIAAEAVRDPGVRRAGSGPARRRCPHAPSVRRPRRCESRVAATRQPAASR
jgi:predicted CoA-binding protein